MEARPKFLYPSVIVAAVAITLFSLTGIASMTGLLPSAHSGEKAALADGKTSVARRAAPDDPPHVAQAHPVPEGKAICSVCGTVQAIDAVEHRGEGSGLGASAGGVAGALLGNQFGAGNGRAAMTIAGGAHLGNPFEKNSRRTITYEIRVRMEDGAVRTFRQNEAPFFSAGERVKIVDHALVPIT